MIGARLAVAQYFLYIIFMRHFIFTMLILCFWSNFTLAEPLSETGLPIPRFVSLKSAEANMRKGPGTRYAIQWVYKRKHLPIEIINEYGHWRQVRDFEGVEGWMHKGMVGADRYVMIQGAAQPLHQSADVESDVLLRLEAGVIAHLEQCNANWCEVTIAGHEGWLPKSGIWGVYPQEVID